MNKNKIGKYEVLGTLGMGGYGNVYKAVSSDGNIVALKTVNPHLSDNSEIKNKFFNEAKILSKLNHPNIGKLIDFFMDDTDCVIVMEYIDGTDLKELMIQEPDNLLPLKQAIKIAGQCLSAFQYAYDMGVLHRDIKPSNIMIDKSGRSIITDFGTAVFIDDASDDNAARMLSTAYSAPERFSRAEKGDIRSEIYSMGMVFYELFTGRKPFNFTSRAEIESWHLNEVPVPVNRLNSSLSSKITAAVKTALEKKPENRFKDFLEFKNAMEI